MDLRVQRLLQDAGKPVPAPLRRGEFQVVGPQHQDQKIDGLLGHHGVGEALEPIPIGQLRVVKVRGPPVEAVLQEDVPVPQQSLGDAGPAPLAGIAPAEARLKTPGVGVPIAEDMLHVPDSFRKSREGERPSRNGLSLGF